MGDEYGDGSIQCSLCTKTFKQRKELFHHMSSAAHRRQSVRCPWCRKMNIFTRVNDLSRHCDSVHFREYSLMPDGFLSIPNCFYLAVYPKDYACMTKIQKYDSTIAIEARRVLISLLNNIKSGDVLRNEIREGWKAGLEIAEKIEKKEKEIKQMREARATAAKKYKKRKNGKENETPAKKLKQKETLEDTKAVYEQMFKTDPITLKIPNTLSNNTPPMSEAELEHTERNEKEAKVVLTRLDENGVRRLMVLTTQNGKVENEELTGKPFKAESGSEITMTEKGNLLDGLSAGEINLEEKEKVVDEVGIVDESNMKKAWKVVEEEDIGDEHVINEHITAVDEVRTDESLRKEQVKVVEVEKETIDESDERCIKTDNPIEGELQVITEFLAYKTAPSEVIDTDVEPEHTEKRKTNCKDCIKKVKFAETAKERISYIDGGETIVNEKGDSVEILKGEDSIWRKVKDTSSKNKESEVDVVGDEARESDKLKGLVKGVERRESIENINPETDESEEAKYVETALSILKKGAMPLCPPARRQWGPDTLEEMDIGNGQLVQWPPKGWLNMTPDKRLLTVEMMAMTLEAFIHGEVAPEMSRCYLLDKYKFLMLPGALIHRKEKGEDTITRARFQNFKFLKEVAAGKKLSFGEVQHLQALKTVSVHQYLTLDPSHFTTPLQLQEGPTYLD